MLEGEKLCSYNSQPALILSAPREVPGSKELGVFLWGHLGDPSVWP